ncbi:MAG: mevalonate kinase [Anaerolineae bacterium]|nr:mevalonate kinase [Anaerolineae bacterium]
MQPLSASAPGKIILFGEHAVVHGQPAIAVPLAAVQVTVCAEPAPPGTGTVIHAPDVDQTRFIKPGTGESADTPDPLYNALVYPVKLALSVCDQPVPDLALTVRSTIPIASGLGSGAALAAALIRATTAALDHPLDNDALNPLVYEVEKRHHGTPSGIDNTVIVYERPVFFVRGTPPEPFTITRPFSLVVGDTGHSSPTRLTVSDVRSLVDAEPDRVGALFEQIGALVHAARTAIESGTIETLGPLMNTNHALLQELTVSSGQLDRLCEAARRAGALGAKLSGGGRGGNMIALTQPDDIPAVAQALRAAGAVRVIHTTVG